MFPYLNIREKDAGYFILIYHRVNDRKDLFTIDRVPVKNFEQQIKYLKNNFRILSLGEILGKIEHQRKIPKRALALTFDDGYEDNYQYAYPILKKYNVPATIFLTVDVIENEKMLWFDEVLDAFINTKKKEIAILGSGEKVAIISEKEKLKTCFKVLGKLKRLPVDERNDKIKNLVKELGLDWRKNKGNEMLKWDQINKMAKDNITFGSHTMTHPILSKSLVSDMKLELEESKRILEERTNRPVEYLAYPNGKRADFHTNVVKIVKDVGYKAGLTTVAGTNYPDTDPFYLHRFRPWQNSIESFAASMSISYLAPFEKGSKKAH